MQRILAIMALLVVTLATTASEGQQKPTPDEAAIRQAVQSYVEAFNRGDAAAVAAHWSDDGEYIGVSGESFKGRKKIEAGLKTFFAENKGVQVQVTPISIRFPSSNRAVETGVVVLTRAEQNPEETQYHANYVKRGGVWKLASVRDESTAVVLPSYDHLKDIEWLIGEWVDADENAEVDTAFRWTKNYSFITSSFSVSAQGKIGLQGTQVIGWDPVAKTIRSWMFDSEGGFGEGTWSKQGNQWVVKTTSILGTGEKASSTNIYSYVDPNTFTWKSIGREVAGEPKPNIDEVTVVRKQPETKPSGKNN
ncbi:MAG: YybH family protein [Desulfomonilaceae bacterium]